jgi:tetratricopeptide (TPR) repeat protein
MSTHPAQSRPLARRRRWPRPTIARVGGAIVLLGLGSIVLPWLMWARQINRAATLIEQGISWPEARWSDTIPSVRDPQQLGQARVALEAAIGWRPGNAYAYRLLGQIAMAEGRWEQAELAFGQASRREPTNPLIAWEQALAYERRSWSSWEPADGQPEDNDLRRLWQQAGLDMEQFIARGDEARLSQRPDEALRWYKRASLFAPQAGIPWYYAGLAYGALGRNEQALQAYQRARALQPDLRETADAISARAERLFGQGDWAGAYPLYLQALQTAGQPADFQFRAALAGSGANRPPRELLKSLGVPVRTITTTTTIEGETMHWLESSNAALADGTPTDPSYINRAWVGTLWWSGAAVAVVEASAGDYVLSVRAASPAGVAAELVLESDGVALGAFETALDGSYSQSQFEVNWTGGTHVVAVRFLNNGVFDGVDNNAFIDWARISR